MHESVQLRPILTERPVGAQIHLSPEDSHIFQGEPCHVGQITHQSLWPHHQRRRHLCHRRGGHHHRACSSAAAAAMIRWCRPGLLKIGLCPWPKKCDTRWRNHISAANPQRYEQPVGLLRRVGPDPPQDWRSLGEGEHSIRFKLSRRVPALRLLGLLVRHCSTVLSGLERSYALILQCRQYR